MPSASTSADAIFQYASCKDPLVLSANLFALLHLQKKATKWNAVLFIFKVKNLEN